MDGKEDYQYTKIKEYIYQNIQKDYYINKKIESENSLSKMFDVSRMTVRQAIQSLQQEGLVYTLPKKGTFVSEKKQFKELDGLRSFSEDVSRLDGQTSSRLILCQKEKTKNQQLITLGLTNQDNEVWHIVRIRYLNNIPVAYEDGYYHGGLIQNIPSPVLKSSLYDYFENELGYEINYASQQIDAMSANEYAKELQVDETTPLLRIEQTTYLKDEQCIEYAYTYYRVDMYSFHQVAYRRRK
ncbi:MAG: GntR family transcriptional regulator [Coprobacillus sp.]